MKIAVFGSEGMLGFDVIKFLKTTSHEIVAPSEKDLDITDKESVQAFMKNQMPDRVINLAALTDVEKCEIDDEYYKRALEVNGDGPKILRDGLYKATKKAKFLHVSTDYVFSDKPNELVYIDDKPSPMNRYGYTKLKGEEIDKASIVRISWLYGDLQFKSFVSKIYHAYNAGKKIKAVGDELGRLTNAKDFAEQFLAKWIEKPTRGGVYHFGNKEVTSRFEVAQRIVPWNAIVIPITTEEANRIFKLKANRPKRVLLELEYTYRKFGYRPVPAKLPKAQGV